MKSKFLVATWLLYPAIASAANAFVGDEIFLIFHFPAVLTILLWIGMLCSETTRSAVGIPFFLGLSMFLFGLLSITGANGGGAGTAIGIWILAYAPLLTLIITVVSLARALRKASPDTDDYSRDPREGW